MYVVCHVFYAPFLTLTFKQQIDEAALIKNWKEEFTDIKSLREDYEGLAKYLLKESNGGGAWNSSKNLKEPKITTNDSKFGRKRVE